MRRDGDSRRVTVMDEGGGLKVIGPPWSVDRDREILDRLSRGYREVLRRYFVRRKLGDGEADDATQDVFSRLARKGGLSELKNLEAYLFETASSVAHDHFRRRAARRADHHESYDDAVHAPAEPSPEEVHAGRRDIERLVEALNELPDRTRNAFILARMEGLKHPEIARRLGVSVSSVEKYVIKATDHLAARVGRV
jgi:RNA polymerase sigma factor (sigma-70 family)